MASSNTRLDGYVHQESPNQTRHTMKRFAYISLAALLLVSSFNTFSADPSNRPAGVTAEEWVPVSDRLGIVLVPPAVSREPLIAPMSPTTLLMVRPLKPAVGGYFMVRGPSGWVRLVLIEPVKGPADAE
jgi:hypothetical protein